MAIGVNVFEWFEWFRRSKTTESASWASESSWWQSEQNKWRSASEIGLKRTEARIDGSVKNSVLRTVYYSLSLPFHGRWSPFGKLKPVLSENFSLVVWWRIINDDWNFRSEISLWKGLRVYYFSLKGFQSFQSLNSNERDFLDLLEWFEED